MSGGEIADVADTAFMVAEYRARETARPDALFRDPFAARLSGERGRAIVDALPNRVFVGGWTVVIRTVIIDAMIQAAVARGVDAVINLGAGLDARPYRMTLPPGLRWVEADAPRVVSYKESVLAGQTPRCRLERAAVDLADAPARRAFLAAAAPSGNALVLTEGVVPYLRPEDVGALADDLRAVPAIQGWIVDYFSPEAYRHRRKAGFQKALQNAPFRFEPEDCFGFFAARHWTPSDVRYIPEEAERLGRPIPLPRFWLWLGALRAAFLPKERREQLKRFAGYAVLTPERR